MINNLVLHSNQKISIIVDKKAFEDVINSLTKTISGIKINDSKTEVEISEKNNNVTFSIEIKISEKLNISEIIKTIKNKIEIHCLFLIDKKPKNILINYVGTF
ncbi:MAG: hypothetical protein HDR43_02540 [Mycoplasma sp.]|nr:hypothetical protein [Mycoplasma sp.]